MYLFMIDSNKKRQIKRVSSNVRDFWNKNPIVLQSISYIGTTWEQRDVIVKSIESVNFKCYDDSIYDPQIHHPVESVINRPYQYGYCWMVENNNGKMPSLEDVRQCFFNIVRLYMSEKQKGREWDVGGSE